MASPDSRFWTAESACQEVPVLTSPPAGRSLAAADRVSVCGRAPAPGCMRRWPELGPELPDESLQLHVLDDPSSSAHANPPTRASPALLHPTASFQGCPRVPTSLMHLAAAACPHAAAVQSPIFDMPSRCASVRHPPPCILHFRRCQHAVALADAIPRSSSVWASHDSTACSHCEHTRRPCMIASSTTNVGCDCNCAASSSPMATDAAARRQ